MTTFATPSESVREHLRNAESLIQSCVLELAKIDMTTTEVTTLAQARDRVQQARETLEKIRALTRGPVSVEAAVALYWKVRELL